MTEAQLHTQVVHWLRMALPESAVLHHSPNEGRRGWIAQRAVKTHGVMPGWPDLEIIYPAPNGAARVIFIELKSKTGRVTATQRTCHHRLTVAGAVVTVCKSLGEVESFLGQLMPLQARLT